MTGQGFYTVRSKEISVRVKAKPGARQDGVLGVRAGELLVAVRAVAEKGRANAEITRLLAGRLGLPRDSVVLKTGGGAPHKVFVLPLSAAPALERLVDGLPGA
jgi:uncharacterized protein